MVRLTMYDLVHNAFKPEGEFARRLLENSKQVEVVAQPADPFDGLGDFDLHPTAKALLDARERSLALAARVEAADVALRNVEAILDRPLSKLPKKDLLVLIRAAQEALV